MAVKRSSNPAYQTAKATKPKKAIAYARCSVKKDKLEQSDKSDSIVAQTDSLTRIVQRFNLSWDGQVFSDDGVSGWKTRDALENLLAAVSQQHGADALAVRSLSRLTRLEPLDAVQLLAKLRDLGIQAIYTEDVGELVLPQSDDTFGWLRLLLECGMTHSQSRATSFNVASAMVSQRFVALLRTPHSSRPGASPSNHAV